MANLKTPARAANTDTRQKTRELESDHFGLIASILPSGEVARVRQLRFTARAFTRGIAREWKSASK